MARIQIFTVLGKNGVLFSDLLLRSMKKLASGENELEFNCFMSSRTVPPDGWNALEYIPKQKHTSLNHTTGLNRSLDYINGDYVICTDADIAILTPDWDKKMLNQMKDEYLSILGVGHWDNPRGYVGFPIVTFFLAQAHSHLLAQPDLRPNLVSYPNKHGVGAKNFKIKTEKDSFILSRPKGSVLLQDSGWQLPYKYHDHRLRGAVFEKATEYLISQVPQIWKVGDEIGICHKGKSSKRRQSKGMKFVREVRRYVHQTHGVEI